MKVVWRGEDDPTELINGKEYEVTAWSDLFNSFGVIDEMDDDVLFPADEFEITEYEPEPSLCSDEKDYYDKKGKTVYLKDMLERCKEDE